MWPIDCCTVWWSEDKCGQVAVGHCNGGVKTSGRCGEDKFGQLTVGQRMSCNWRTGRSGSEMSNCLGWLLSLGVNNCSAPFNQQFSYLASLSYSRPGFSVRPLTITLSCLPVCNSLQLPLQFTIYSLQSPNFLRVCNWPYSLQLSE